jgi:peptidoglycan/LPS O-acetylase OafA/YrhL
MTSTSPTDRIPSLDGLRAVAIALVIVSHLQGTRGFPHFSLPVELGSLGVRVFFVISGLLITTLMLQEHRKYGSVSVARFFMRRTLRIFPAMYFFLLAVAVAARLDLVSLSPGDMFHAATYTMNYHSGGSWTLGHLWSLAVEEQFYLLWPLAFALFGLRGAMFGAVGVVVLAPVVRTATLLLSPQDLGYVGTSFETVADSLATGCLIAGCRQGVLLGGVNWTRFRHALIAPTILLVVLAAASLKRSVSFSFPVGETVMNGGIAALIVWCISNPGSTVGLLLNSRPFVVIGGLSYSLYLWQQPFFDRTADQWWCTFPQNLALAVLMAVLSYQVVEKAGLRFRGWLEPRVFTRRTPSRAGAEPTA